MLSCSTYPYTTHTTPFLKSKHDLMVDKQDLTKRKLMYFFR